ncbi:signal transduction histidine kinase [Actinoalloteichus hoggarensis]|uniref:Sensor histidine kinase LiaS n=1 Tax=Actinoalloteichus hoggarensis TaxID=1470176 RepID=A0A221W2M3_9PSEU|nr:ATP-binding protein [Actinoalloteichus hoggarensis]ASO20052.1 Sensor histidine kinase LiaS [Actinoalloteichus hoggarensis]MBB5919237.1 signal transduction histidine kinase [Actinoalloteichus hoggarensis]
MNRFTSWWGRAGRLRRLRGLAPGGTLGWLDPRYMLSKPGEERARRFIAVLMFGQRASYLLPALAASQGAGYHDAVLNGVLLACAVGWNVFMAVGIGRRGWFTHGMVAVDVLVGCLLLAAVTANCLPGTEFTSVNWSSKYALGTAALIGATLAPRAAILVSLLPMVCYVWALSGGGASFTISPNMIGHLNSCLWFGLLLHYMRRYLSAQSRTLDETSQRRLATEVAKAADQARFHERIAHYRTLHDTALATLTAIARGGLDHRTDQVRRRCAKDADYIRRLIVEDSAGGFTGLGDKLAEVMSDAEGLGLRVHYLPGALPAHLPRHVVDAVADACREGLNNVARHARSSEAWVTVDWEDAELVVRIVDRGIGFDPDVTPRGLGLGRSVIDRMREVGGRVELFSLSGEGTCLELSWRQAIPAVATSHTASAGPGR